jgi:hypothetical protein
MKGSISSNRYIMELLRNPFVIRKAKTSRDYYTIRCTDTDRVEDHGFTLIDGKLYLMDWTERNGSLVTSDDATQEAKYQIAKWKLEGKIV